MKYYLLLISATILGQLFVASIGIYYYQLQNDCIGYWKAAKIFANKQLAVWFVIILFTMIILFVLPDWMDLSLSRATLEAKTTLTRFEKLQKIYRTFAVVYGVGAQWIALLAFKGTRNAILKYGKSNNIQI